MTLRQPLSQTLLLSAYAFNFFFALYFYHHNNATNIYRNEKIKEIKTTTFVCRELVGCFFCRLFCSNTVSPSSTLFPIVFSYAIMYHHTIAPISTGRFSIPLGFALRTTGANSTSTFSSPSPPKIHTNTDSCPIRVSSERIGYFITFLLLLFSTPKLAPNLYLLCMRVCRLYA